MHKIDGYGNVSGSFTEGNPGTGVPATQITDDWLNASQEEMVNVIQFDGTALNKADNTQLLTAIKKMMPKRWGVSIIGSNCSTLAEFDAATPYTIDDIFTHNGGIMYTNSIQGAFSILFSMFVTVTESTYIPFYTYACDDTAYLYIDDVLVHTFTAGTGFDFQSYSASVSAGNHKIEILLNNTGGDNVDLITYPFINNTNVFYLRSGRV